MKHIAISARRLAIPNRACSHLPHNFWSLYKWSYSLSQWRLQLSFSLSGHIGSPNHVDYSVLDDQHNFMHVVQSLFWTHDVYLVSVLRSTPNHIPLKYRCVDYCCVRFRHVSTLQLCCPHVKTKTKHTVGIMDLEEDGLHPSIMCH